MRRRPANVFEGDGPRSGLGAGGEDGSDGDVIGPGEQGALRLLGGVGAEAKLK